MFRTFNHIELIINKISLQSHAVFSRIFVAGQYQPSHHATTSPPPDRMDDPGMPAHGLLGPEKSVVCAGHRELYARSRRRGRPDPHQAPRPAHHRREQPQPRTGRAVQLLDLVQLAHRKSGDRHLRAAVAPGADRGRRGPARNTGHRHGRMQRADTQRAGPPDRRPHPRGGIHQRPDGQCAVRRHEDLGHRRGAAPGLLRPLARPHLDIRRPGHGRRHDRLRRAQRRGRHPRTGRRAHDRAPRPHLEGGVRLPGLLPPAERHRLRQAQQVQGPGGRDQPEPQLLPLAGRDGRLGGHTHRNAHQISRRHDRTYNQPAAGRGDDRKRHPARHPAHGRSQLVLVRHLGGRLPRGRLLLPRLDAAHLQPHGDHTRQGQPQGRRHGPGGIQR